MDPYLILVGCNCMQKKGTDKLQPFWYLSEMIVILAYLKYSESELPSETHCLLFRFDNNIYIVIKPVFAFFKNFFVA